MFVVSRNKLRCNLNATTTPRKSRYRDNAVYAIKISQNEIFYVVSPPGIEGSSRKQAGFCPAFSGTK